MSQNILLVNPPIYDFTAYDFWLKPYGLLNVAGRVDSDKISLFDFLGSAGKKPGKEFGLGKFLKQRVENPTPLKDIPRPYHRFGAPRELFVEYLKNNPAFDAALVGCGMTYWYPGVREVVETLRRLTPKTVVILGGIYPTLCPEHAASLGADLVVEGIGLKPLEKYLPLKNDGCLPRWDLCGEAPAGVMKLSSGCPYSCTYCASKRIDSVFQPKPSEIAFREYCSLVEAGAEDIAFYDDALLYDFDNNLFPFLDKVREKVRPGRFHTPNGLHLKYLTAGVSKKLVDSNFKTFFLSLESVDEKWHEEADRKAGAALFETALENLLSAGAERSSISAYILMGHPAIDHKMLSETLRFLGSRNIRPRLSEFSPIPGTPDGDACSVKTDLAEPLNHNKLAWTLRFYGDSKFQKIKEEANLISKKIRSGN